jgi:uncharacterized protein YcbK (DUF882 family)
MIRKYSKGSHQRLSADFCSCEFDCKCQDPKCIDTYISEELVNGLQLVRNEVGHIIVNSGFRCAEHNKKNGGKPRSLHLTGEAADIRAKSTGIKNLINAVFFAPLFLEGGVGIYQDRVHVDVGPKRRWFG